MKNSLSHCHSFPRQSSEHEVMIVKKKPGTFHFREISFVISSLRGFDGITSTSICYRGNGISVYMQCVRFNKIVIELKNSVFILWAVCLTDLCKSSQDK